MCGVCAPGTFCSFGDCIPFPVGQGPPVGPPAGLGPPAVAFPPIIPPGGGQFGSPCPKKYRFMNNACIFTGSATKSFKITRVVSIIFTGIFIQFLRKY